MITPEAGYTQALAELAVGATFSDLPARTVEATKRVVLDTLGCAVGGRGVGSSEIITKLKVAAGGSPEATLLAGGERLPLTSAVYVNAHYGNALDAEETILHSGHLAACAVPPALSVAEATGASGSDLVAAVAIGFDVAARLGLSLRNLERFDDGHVEIAKVFGLTWAAFAATVATGRMIGLDADSMAQAFGITVATAPLPIAGVWGNMPAPRPMTKYGMYGPMAEAGVFAAQLAAGGFVGDRTIFDGDRGFWRIMGSRALDSKWLTDRLGDRWLIEETSFKLHPACRYATPTLDLYYQLASEAGVESPDDIDHVEVLVPQAMLAKHMDDPTVVTVVDGQFSVPYLVALAANYVPPGPQWHTDTALGDGALRKFAERVTVKLYPEGEALLARLLEEQGHAELIPTAMTMIVRGQAHTASTDHASGDPWATDSLLGDDVLRDKFRRFCAPFLPPESIEAAIQLIAKIDDEPTVMTLVAALVA